MKIALLAGHVLTDEHAACSHGIPVLVTPDGQACGPMDILGPQSGRAFQYAPAAHLVHRWATGLRRLETREERDLVHLFLSQWPGGPQLPEEGGDDMH